MTKMTDSSPYDHTHAKCVDQCWLHVRAGGILSLGVGKYHLIFLIIWSWNQMYMCHESPDKRNDVLNLYANTLRFYCHGIAETLDKWATSIYGPVSNV